MAVPGTHAAVHWKVLDAQWAPKSSCGKGHAKELLPDFYISYMLKSNFGYGGLNNIYYYNYSHPLLFPFSNAANRTF